MSIPFHSVSFVKKIFAHFVFFLLFLVPFGAGAQGDVVLSDSARISLLTVAPGAELYSTFGHSTLRVTDPARRIDRCYNYGTFDFDQSNFYIKFCRGKLLYQIEVERWEQFEYSNMQDRRTMREQVLRLNRNQRQLLFELLEENMLPQNRQYRYDFFYDNCATRIRDIVRKAAWQITLDFSHVRPGTTMRQLLRPYLVQHPWTQFGIDLVLGMPTDKVARADDYMFLPDGVHRVFENTRLPEGQPLVEKERTQPQPPFPLKVWQPGILDRPFWVVSAICILGLLSMLHARLERVFDFCFWLALGVAGLIIALLWFATDHVATKMNLNILWALPTHLLFFTFRRRTEWVENYFTAVAALSLLTLVFWNFLPQEMPLEGIPIAMLTVVKGFWRRYKRPVGDA